MVMPFYMDMFSAFFRHSLVPSASKASNYSLVFGGFLIIAIFCNTDCLISSSSCFSKGVSCWKCVGVIILGFRVIWSIR